MDDDEEVGDELSDDNGEDDWGSDGAWEIPDDSGG